MTVGDEKAGVRSGTAPERAAAGSASAAPATADPDRLATAYLLRVAEPPAPAVHALVDRYGARAAADLVRRGEVPDAVAAETAARRHLDLAAADLTEAARAGARLVIPSDAEWPSWPLTALACAAARGQHWATPPLGLWVCGTAALAELLASAVAVVGARAATGYGEHVATEFGHGLAEAGYTVISGAAYGIDGAAHRGALAAEAGTVAVLACGVDISYPAGHADLLRRITERGALLSEYPPGAPPGRHRFLVRNRLIAALSGGTVVVEAGKRSGARNTAALADGIGRVVMAVPGPVTSAMSVGCHALLRTGQASLVSTPGEVLECVGRIGTDLVDEPDQAGRPTDVLDGESMRVYEALGTRTARTVERVAVESGVTVSRLRAVLPVLELSGLAHRTDAGWRRGAPDQPP